MPTNFLWNSGTGNNGLIASALTLMTTELNSLTSGSYAISSVGGSSGVFTNSNTAQALFGTLSFTFGGTVTPASPLNLSMWFLRSLDGTTFEDSSNLLARPPDVIFAFSANAYASKTVMNAGGLVTVPPVNFKVAVQNNAGASLAASGNTIKLGLSTPQY